MKLVVKQKTSLANVAWLLLLSHTTISFNISANLGLCCHKMHASVFLTCVDVCISIELFGFSPE